MIGVGLVSGLLAILLFAPPASAVTGANWNAGNIMSDGVFFSPGGMSTTDIYNFLNTKVPVCDTWHASSNGNNPPFTCLKDYVENPTTHQNNANGGAVSGGWGSPQIIKYAADTYSINPKVLIVLLQKEQSLVTDTWPWTSQYRSATGYGCPATAPCDAEYYGFYNQVMNAARQFRRYATYPADYRYKAFQSNYIQYNENPGCGGTNVTIANQATAGLYNYTPYQPNASALANLYGSGDSCGAYGNRNFWRMYNDWFGSTQISTPYAWWYVGQQAFTDAARTIKFTSVPTTTSNGKTYVRVQARNIGTKSWSKGLFRIGTSHPMGRTSIMAASDWISDARPATLVEDSVAPGQIGTFEFTLQSPAAVGTYNEYFNLLLEGQTWLNDPGLYFKVNVNTTSGVSNYTNTGLGSGKMLKEGGFLMSPDSQSVVAVGRNGNLNLYSNFKPIWTASSAGAKNTKLLMQPDGNLVLYDANNKPLWNTVTSGNPGAWLAIQTDGNLVVYSQNSVPLWASYTIHTPSHLSYINTTLPNGLMYPGQRIDTADRKYSAILQIDGNLVLYKQGIPLWASGTDGKNVSFLAMQTDGNLVLYDKSYRPLWYTGSSNTRANRLIMQQDGNLVLYTRDNRPIWASGTANR